MRIEVYSSYERGRYIQSKYGFRELAKDTREYQDEYEEMRSSLLLQHAPELLGDNAEILIPKNHTEQEIRKFIEENMRRQQMARQVPIEQFDISMHIFKRVKDENEMRITIEERFGTISGLVTGGKSAQREFQKINRDIYQYYGVAKEDIEKKTSRYKQLVSTLFMR